MVLGEFDEGRVFDSSGTDENHAVGGVVRLDVVREVVAGDGEDVFLGSEDRSSKGLSCWWYNLGAGNAENDETWG